MFFMILYSLINENGTFYYRTIQNKDHSEIWDPILNEISLNMQWDKATEFILRSREVHDEVSKVK